MSPAVSTFLFEVANFLVLAAVLGWFFFQPVRNALEERRGRLANEEQQAAQKLAEAEHAKQEIEEVRADLQNEINVARNRELEAAREQAKQLLDESRAKIEHELDASRRRAAMVSETQTNRLAEAAVHAAAETVGKLLDKLEGTDIHIALLNSACHQLRTLPRDQLAPVKVESSQPLTRAERQEVEQALGAAAVSADFRINESVGKGVRISTSSGLIDSSTSGLVSFARQALQKAMNHQESVDEAKSETPAEKTEADSTEGKTTEASQGQGNA